MLVLLLLIFCFPSVVFQLLWCGSRGSRAKRRAADLGLLRGPGVPRGSSWGTMGGQRRAADLGGGALGPPSAIRKLPQGVKVQAEVRVEAHVEVQAGAQAVL